MEKMGELPGFKSLNVAGEVTKRNRRRRPGQAHAYNIFVNRAVLPKGMTDPIREPVLVFDGEDGCERVDVEALTKELGVARPAEEMATDAATEPGDGDPAAQGPDAGGGALAGPGHASCTPSRRSGNPRPLSQSVSMNKVSWWGHEEVIGVGKAIWGACGGEAWGFGIWAEWCSRWKGDDPEENKEEWRGFQEGRQERDRLPPRLGGRGRQRRGVGRRGRD